MNGAKVLLFGSKLRIVASVLGVLVLLVGGAFAAGVVGTPSVSGVENHFGDVNESTTVVESDLLVSNPNPIGVNLGGTSASYAVRMNDVTMARGEKAGISVPEGESRLHFSTLLQNEKIPTWWVGHIRNGEHTELVVETSVHSSTFGRTFGAPDVERPIETEMISAFNSTETRPVDADRPAVSNPVAYVNRTSANWGEVTNETTPIEMRFDVYNPKTTPLTITEIGYQITMNGVRVGEGASEQTYVVESRETETVDTRTEITNANLDEWWVTHLENDQVTELRIDFYAEVDLSVLGGGTVRVPLDALTYTETVETDIFGTKNASAPGEETTTGTEETGTEPDGTDTGTTDGTSTPDESTTESDESTSESDEPTTETTTSEDDGLLSVAGPRYGS